MTIDAWMRFLKKVQLLTGRQSDGRDVTDLKRKKTGSVKGKKEVNTKEKDGFVLQNRIVLLHFFVNSSPILCSSY